jgi:hypothetical protein
MMLDNIYNTTFTSSTTETKLYDDIISPDGNCVVSLLYNQSKKCDLRFYYCDQNLSIYYNNIVSHVGRVVSASVYFSSTGHRLLLLDTDEFHFFLFQTITGQLLRKIKYFSIDQKPIWFDNGKSFYFISGKNLRNSYIINFNDQCQIICKYNNCNPNTLMTCNRLGDKIMYTNPDHKIYILNTKTKRCYNATELNANYTCNIQWINNYHFAVTRQAWAPIHHFLDNNFNIVNVIPCTNKHDITISNQVAFFITSPGYNNNYLIAYDNKGNLVKKINVSILPMKRKKVTENCAMIQKTFQDNYDLLTIITTRAMEIIKSIKINYSSWKRKIFQRNKDFVVITQYANYETSMYLGPLRYYDTVDQWFCKQILSQTTVTEITDKINILNVLYCLY